MAFEHLKPRKISEPQSCVTASGDKMSSLGLFKVDLWIKGKKFIHPLNVINELNGNIIGIDFIHKHKLKYDMITRQVKFAGAGVNSIMALKQTVLPAMTSTMVKAKYKSKNKHNATSMANICIPRTPMISGMPSIVPIDENNICNIIVQKLHTLQCDT